MSSVKAAALLLVSALVLAVVVDEAQAETMSILTSTVTFQNLGNQTMFNITSTLGHGVSFSMFFLAVGINTAGAMNGTNAMICINFQNTTYAEHRHNMIRTPTLFDPTVPTMGLSNVSIVVRDTTVSCTYYRDNTNPNPYYWNITDQSEYHIISSYGVPNATGILLFVIVSIYFNPILF